MSSCLKERINSYRHTFVSGSLALQIMLVAWGTQLRVLCRTRALHVNTALGESDHLEPEMMMIQVNSNKERGVSKHGPPLRKTATHLLSANKRIFAVVT